MDSGLMLESAKKRIRQQEAVEEQRNELQAKFVSLQAIGGKTKGKPGKPHRKTDYAKSKPQCT